MNFVAGVLSSLLASLLLILGSRISLRWIRRFPRGVEFLRPNRQEYVDHIATMIRSNRETFFFKGLTGYDLFSSEQIREALLETRIDGWKEFVLVLTDPSSEAFHVEPNDFYSAERLAGMQKIVVDFIQEQALPLRSRYASISGIFYVQERRTLVNILVLDKEAIVFFRGFTKLEGPTGQVIVKIKLLKCPALIRDLINTVKNHYIESSRGGPAVLARLPVQQHEDSGQE